MAGEPLEPSNMVVALHHLADALEQVAHGLQQRPAPVRTQATDWRKLARDILDGAWEEHLPQFMVEHRLRDALDDLWANMPADRIPELSSSTVLVAQYNHDRIWSHKEEHPTEKETGDDTTSSSATEG